MIRRPTPTATATSRPATMPSIARAHLASMSRIRGRAGGQPVDTGDATADDPGTAPDGGRRVGCPDGGGWGTAVQARRSIEAAPLRHLGIRPIAVVEATLPS